MSLKYKFIHFQSRQIFQLQIWFHLVYCWVWSFNGICWQHGDWLLRGTWKCLTHFMAIHQRLVEVFHSRTNGNFMVAQGKEGITNTIIGCVISFSGSYECQYKISVNQSHRIRWTLTCWCTTEKVDQHSLGLKSLGFILSMRIIWVCICLQKTVAIHPIAVTVYGKTYKLSLPYTEPHH